jgi:hypothetical protein
MMQRTTIAADPEDLDALRRDAERKGMSFARYMAQVVAERAGEVRQASRPRFGVGQSGGGVAMASVDDEDLPARGE